MHVIHTIEALRTFRRSSKEESWGLVPTMGFLHEGHLQLVRRARQDNDRVAVSLFVNPAQFGEPEDLTHYPRALERDLQLLRDEGVDLVFCPSDEEMYPTGFQTYVVLEQITQPLEGASRPTHFRGVATVLAKLFNLVQPHHAYFGQKDAQQTVVVRRLVRDLDFDLQVVICPTIREQDGLAMSSRNARLTPAQREAAPLLFKVLESARQALEGGERDGDTLRQRMRREIELEPLAELDYVSVADPETLLELGSVDTAALLSLAVSFGSVRLIDNVPVENLVPVESRAPAENLVRNEASASMTNSPVVPSTIPSLQQDQDRSDGTMRMLYRSKIHQARVTAADVRYVGSITIDAELIELAGFWEWEKVLVVSNTSGARLETYIIAGEKGSGAIEMNGAAAHLIKTGEEVIIIGFELTERPIEPTAILVDKDNRFVRFLSHPGDRPTKDPAAEPRQNGLV